MNGHECSKKNYGNVSDWVNVAPGLQFVDPILKSDLILHEFKT